MPEILEPALGRDAGLAVCEGPGALAFAAVVELTLLAAQNFDPRLIRDPVDGR